MEQDLRERAATALGDDSLLGVQFHAGLIALRAVAVAANSEISRGDAPYRAVFAVKHLRRGEAGVDLDPELFRLAREPAAQVAEADDVVAVIVHLRRRR